MKEVERFGTFFFFVFFLVDGRIVEDGDDAELLIFGSDDLRHVIKVLDENAERGARGGDSHDGAIGSILVGETVLKGVVDELFDSGDPMVAKSKTVIVAGDNGDRGVAVAGGG
jgi:hypothetical protein